MDSTTPWADHPSLTSSVPVPPTAKCSGSLLRCLHVHSCTLLLVQEQRRGHLWVQFGLSSARTLPANRGFPYDWFPKSLFYVGSLFPTKQSPSERFGVHHLSRGSVILQGQVLDGFSSLTGHWSIDQCFSCMNPCFYFTTDLWLHLLPSQGSLVYFFTSETVLVLSFSRISNIYAASLRWICSCCLG